MPHRSWLIYASSPLQNRAGVHVSIPGRNGELILPLVAVEGSFYEVSDKSATIFPIMP
jgi:hypothetical protein